MALISRRSFFLSLPLISLIPITYSYYETKTIEITKLNLGLSFKAAFLVDTHTHEFGEVEGKVIDIVKKEEVDLILVGGDFVDELTRDFKVVEKYIKDLEAKEKFAVMGNHEYWSGKAEELSKILKDNKFKILYDSYELSSYGKIYGIDWRDTRIYKEIKAEGLVLAHDPNAAKFISGKCLILSGHTHGGVVFGNMVLLSNSQFVRGFYNLSRDTKLYVSRGLGQMFPLRPTSPLELLILE
ncbi:hypothetical protein HRbin06_00986 [archaeon HR06]|nr:hypothetical protein HRbin06_00986 [archaeon HR06]